MKLRNTSSKLQKYYCVLTSPFPYPSFLFSFFELLFVVSCINVSHAFARPLLTVKIYLHGTYYKLGLYLAFT